MGMENKRLLKILLPITSVIIMTVRFSSGKDLGIILIYCINIFNKLGEFISIYLTSKNS